MKLAVVSYSFSGNNDALAKSVAEELAAEHIKITEPTTRKMGRIALDMMFNRTPKVQPMPEKLEGYDLILFAGPVWMGQTAAPLRAYFNHLKGSSQRYVFISISGGADGGNPKLPGELKKRTGKEPLLLMDLHIAGLIPGIPKPSREETSSYKINKDDIKKLSDTVAKAVREEISRWN